MNINVLLLLTQQALIFEKVEFKKMKSADTFET